MDKIFAQAKLANPSSSVKGDASSETSPKPLPPGVVLGKDGKPCRTCTDSAAWKALMASSSSSKKTSAALSSPPSSTSTEATSNPSSASSLSSTPDCPPDVAALGRSTWTLLHSLAATYPSRADPARQNEMSQFLSLFSKLYPCWVCAEDFQDWMKKEKPVLETRVGFGDWMCRAHNEVNVKLGKPVFDCGKWEERWRTGWKDGSCD